jgi:hypothetical protein
MDAGDLRPLCSGRGINGLIAWRTASWTIRSAKDRKDLEWLAEMGRSIQVSLVAFAAGGTFLGLSYFDLYWHLVAIVVVGKVLTQQYLAASGSEIVSRRDAPFRSWTVSRDS